MKPQALLLLLAFVFSVQTFADDVTMPFGARGDAKEEFKNQPRLPMPIVVYKTEWSENDEQSFAHFVTQFGRAVQAKKCSSVKSCMRLPEANRYAQRDPQGLMIYADCADFPYLMRAYFAYHNGLPMSYVKRLKMSDRPYSSRADRDEDLPKAGLENSVYGNLVVSRGGANISAHPGEEKNLIDYLVEMYASVSTRSFRVGPLSPNYDLADLYPVEIKRGSVGPGAIVHSTGHAYMIFDVDDRGVVHMIDAHPDGSITKKELKASALDRSRPDHGLGIMRFRPVRLENALLFGSNYYGGVVTPISDDELFDSQKWSAEQWFGPGSSIEPRSVVAPDLWKEAFASYNFFDFVSDRLRSATTVLYPDEEIQNSMNSVCTELQQRVDDVSLALGKGYYLNTQPHPETLPQNIYSATDPWESTSSPSRDSRLKASVEDIIKNSVKLYRQAKAGQGGLRYDGTPEEYVASLRQRLRATDASCKLAYVNSVGKRIPLSFQIALVRLNRFSFDPYHCAERRWGASSGELASCVDKDVDGAWYRAQQVMRNVVRKTTATERLTIRSDRPITLSMLADKSLIDQRDSSPVNLGTARVPVTDLDRAFESAAFLEELRRR